MKNLFTIIILTFFSFTYHSQEICNNAIDDDGDGLIDLNDTDCQCATSSTNQPSSLIPNPSFELQNCCPQSYSELNCATSWGQASEATADYIHNCNLVFPGLTNTALINYPDGNGAAGGIIQNGYKEYIGACLNSPMIAGTQYTIKMSVGLVGLNNIDYQPMDLTYLPPFQWTIYGAQTCGNIPFVGWECPPTNIFAELGSVAIINDGQYHVLTIVFTPTTNISEIVLGAPCTLPAGYPDSGGDFPYYIVDNLLINTSSSFSGVQITESGSFCTNDYKLTATTGSAGTFQWYKNGIAIIGQTNAVLNFSTQGLTDGTYTVTNTIGSNCSKAEKIITNSTSAINLQVNSGNICSSQSLTLTATGGTTYSWSPATGLSATSGAVVQANPTATTTYTITGTNNGCTATVLSQVTVLHELPIQVSNMTTCQNNPVQLTANGADTYTWTPSTGLSATVGSTVTSTVPVTTTYTVSGVQGLCSGQANVTVTIDNSIDFTGTSNQAVVETPETDVTLTALPLGNNYTWIFNDSTESNLQSITTHLPEEPGIYTITLIAEKDGCIDTLSLSVFVKESLTFYVPNTFTPDGDKYNNVFLPVFTSGFDHNSFKLTIFNRWGELIFESNNTTSGWDGKYKGQNSMEGSYVWVIEYKDSYTDYKQKINGHVNLFR